MQNQIDFEELTVLDLFAGTGNITFEFASRGASRVLAVDQYGKCAKFVKDTATELGLAGVEAIKADAVRFITRETEAFGLVFADPPYDWSLLPQLPEMVLQAGLLKPEGLLIVEHPSTRKLAPHPAWQETRKYGYSSFSFYRQD